GNPIDGKPPVISDEIRLSDYDPPLATKRVPIREIVSTGIRSIDGLLTVGRGQRLGIFAGTGVGKSTLLGMIARYSKADINVICLVGERGREVTEFIENDLGEGLDRSVVIAATNDRSAMEKVYAPGFATSIAEYFRDKGMHVNLLMDSVTRYCMALRETGIASGEQIGPGGYPPGVWFRLSRLLERSGSLSHGSITGFYTVLVEADDMNEPVADNTRGFLDGHIVLSRRLAQKNHYPAIEVTESISRVMDKIVEPEVLENAKHIRTLLAAYKENEDLINLGAYARGSSRDVDEAISKLPQINDFLKQKVEEGSTLEESERALYSIVHSDDEEAFY
ncbi:MAG: FliI/YscN family ATPase, partial [Spirochaetia bacterium]|nr:FliI/YscN family ATPase [Spirochaetia bacterium]